MMLTACLANSSSRSLSGRYERVAKAAGRGSSSQKKTPSFSSSHLRECMSGSDSELEFIQKNQFFSTVLALWASNFRLPLRYAQHIVRPGSQSLYLHAFWGNNSAQAMYPFLVANGRIPPNLILGFLERARAEFRVKTSPHIELDTACASNLFKSLLTAATSC